MERTDSTFVGLDTSKQAIQVAMLFPDGHWEEWQARTAPRSVARLSRQLRKKAVGALRVCYEAGPCGYALQRQLTATDIDCVVVAPALIPVKPGDRVKTDRRDARHLAQCLRAGTLTAVRPPTSAEEAVRDLCRCRDAARVDRERARHRLGKLLLRRGLLYPGRAWTQAHRRWLRQLTFEHASDRVVFADYLRTVEYGEERLADLDRELVAVSQSDPYREPVGWLRCYRGIDTVTALGIVSELHGFPRFDSPRALMAYLGLVPSEHSSGAKTRRGGITKAGNAHVRRLLIEAAFHARHRPAVSQALRARRAGQPGWVIALADRAQTRLHKRYWRLQARGKAHNKAVVAVARELAGFLWATLIEAHIAAQPQGRAAA